MRRTSIKTAIATVLIAQFSCASSLLAGTPPDGGFDRYVLAAVAKLFKERGGLGYGNYSYTHDLRFGDAGVLKATRPPLTMCVAAQLEILVEALNIYANETGDYKPFHHMPKTMWTRLGPLDFRGMIWIVKRKTSNGASSAFERYGIGHKLAFKDMFPGAFLNLNRTNGGGHAVVFLSFIDKNGDDLNNYSSDVAGFRYFSSQGKADRPGGGLGYRWAFFSDKGCPKLTDGRKRDCGVRRSEENGILAGGYVSIPTSWDREKANSAILDNNEASDPELLIEGTFNSEYFRGETTDD